MTFMELRAQIVALINKASDEGLTVHEIHGVITSIEPETRYGVIYVSQQKDSDEGKNS